MGKILLFIYDGMADFEMTFATHLLGLGVDKEIIPIAFEDKLITSKPGIIYKPAKLVKDVLDEDVDGLVIPGGWNGEIREELMVLIQKLYKSGKLVSAICAGPRFLAKAGILEDVKYTTSLAAWSEQLKEQFKEEDPFPRNNYVQARVVRDKNVITALGNAFVDFGIELCDYFKGFENDEDRKEYTKAIKGCE